MSKKFLCSLIDLENRILNWGSLCEFMQKIALFTTLKNCETSKKNYYTNSYLN